MVGDPQKNDKNFTPDKYDEFYSSHHFEPIPEQAAYDVHEVVPRFSWGFDKVLEFYGQKKRNLRILDLGCLDGSFILSVVNNQPWATGVGVDLTMDGIAIARTRAEEKLLKATFIQGNIEDVLKKLIEDNELFDIVTWFEVIEHVKSPKEVIGLIDQVIRSDGIVLCSTPAFEDPLFGMDDEENTCHIRLYTTKEHDYAATNKYGHSRSATSMSREIGSDRIIEMNLHNHLINVMYQ